MSVKSQRSVWTLAIVVGAAVGCSHGSSTPPAPGPEPKAAQPSGGQNSVVGSKEIERSAGVPQDRRFNISFTRAGIGTFSDIFGAFGGQQGKR